MRRVYLFGSYADGTATESSDVDFYVEFTVAPLSVFTFLGLRASLTRALGKEADVVKLPARGADERRVLVYEA